MARAEGVPVAANRIQQIENYVGSVPGTVGSSLLIALAQAKRTEVEALQGSVVRRAARAGVQAPIMGTLYAVLKPFAAAEPENSR